MTCLDTKRWSFTTDHQIFGAKVEILRKLVKAVRARTRCWRSSRPSVQARLSICNALILRTNCYVIVSWVVITCAFRPENKNVRRVVYDYPLLFFQYGLFESIEVKNRTARCSHFPQYFNLLRVTLFGGMADRRNDGTEWQNTRNILRYGIHGIL